MKDCNEFREMISSYIDGLLNEEEVQKLNSHMETCAKCRNELAAVRQVMELCSTLEDEELPVDFNTKLHERLVIEKAEIERYDRMAARRRYIRIFSTVAACLLLVVFLKAFWGSLGFSPFQGTKSDEMADGARSEENTAEQQFKDKINMSILAPGEEQPQEQESIKAAEDNAGSGESAPAADTFDGKQKSADPQPGAAARNMQQNRSSNLASKMTIKLYTDDPDVLVDNLQASSVSYLSQPYEEDEQNKEAPIQITGSQDQITWQISVPQKLYDQFLEMIKANYAANGMELGMYETQDVTKELEELTKKLEALSSTQVSEEFGINTAEETTEANTDEKQQVQDQLERLKLETQNVQVTFTIVKE